jgi:hypothetical protein
MKIGVSGGTGLIGSKLFNNSKLFNKLRGGIAMETHADVQVPWHPRRATVLTTTTLRVGALAGIAAGLMYALWQMVVAAIAQEPTAVPGIHQTLWTPPEGIWSVVFGVHHFHGSFHFVPVFGGIAGHLGNSLVLGILGVGLLTKILGRRPNPAMAVVLGVAYGIAVDAILIDGIINTQKIQTLYSAAPHWSWWVGHAILGVTLGLFGSVLLRINRPSKLSELGSRDRRALMISGSVGVASAT